MIVELQYVLMQMWPRLLVQIALRTLQLVVLAVTHVAQSPARVNQRLQQLTFLLIGTLEFFFSGKGNRTGEEKQSGFTSSSADQISCNPE